MGELSPTHWLIVLVVALVLFGGSRLPEVARGLGRSARILRAELSGTGRESEGPAPRDGSAQPAEGGDAPASEDDPASGAAGSR